MKDLIIYYIFILTPIGIIFWLKKVDLIGEKYFLVLFLFYAFIYRTYIDGKKLVEKNVLLKRNIWKLIIPGYRLKYLKELYLK
ncbi:hypothetical protein [Snuella lapsa]|uniref:Uncharacterized protein n=1 Tax=Snuella lapsa TaxID=870481 RepID=A0ABP6XXF4_9FLAO